VALLRQDEEKRDQWHDGCESAPKWDPCRFHHKSLIQPRKPATSGGPDRRRPGPHPRTNFLLEIKCLLGLEKGSHFGADSHQVLRFAKPEHAKRFMQEFGGEPMHPSESGKGKNWAQWKKGTYRPKP
jgi:hypothetical protein